LDGFQVHVCGKEPCILVYVLIGNLGNSVPLCCLNSIGLLWKQNTWTLYVHLLSGTCFSRYVRPSSSRNTSM